MINEFEKLKLFYKIGKELSFKDIETLFHAANKKTFESNTYLLEEGSLKNKIFYIQKGLVRIFMINDKGEEITTTLRSEYQVVVNVDIFLYNEPSRFYIQALEPTLVFSMEYDALQTIIDRNPKLEKNRKFVLQQMLKENYKRLESFLLYTPEERYIRYIASNPQIINRVPDKYIANVLGITPVSLSRIRKRIASKKNPN